MSAAAYAGAEAPIAQEENVQPPEGQAPEPVSPLPSGTAEPLGRKEAFREKGETGLSLRSGKMKVAVMGLLVLILALAAWFIFFHKEKEVRPDSGAAKVTDEVKTGQPEKADKAPVVPDAAAKEAKLKEYAAKVKQAAENVKQDAVNNQKIVFMVEDVQQSGADLVVTGKFFNGKKDRTITAVKEMEFDVTLRDVDTVVADLKGLRSEKSYTGLKINPLETTAPMRITLTGKAPQKPFNNFSAKGHHIHWEGTGR